jgi:hypothetical protein
LKLDFKIVERSRKRFPFGKQRLSVKDEGEEVEWFGFATLKKKTNRRDP